MSTELTLESSDEEILLYFKIAGEGLDAQTFANSLLAFDELYRAINAVANPGQEIEVDFIRSDVGSIRAIIRIFKKDTQTLLRAPVTLLILPILIAVVVTKVMSDPINITVNDDSYVVQQGAEKVVLPRSAAGVVRHVDNDVAVRRTIRKFFSVVESDPNVSAVDFRLPQLPDAPVIPIGKDQFAVLRTLPEPELAKLPKKREEPYSHVPVVVLTAVLEKSKRKWQFLWNGHKIAADIRDDAFFAKLANHEYEFGQGDTLTVDLVAEQELNELVGAYENKSFYIAKVHRHSKGPKQEPMPF
jgi:hypothetical protein